MQVDLIDGGEP